MNQVESLLDVSELSVDFSRGWRRAPLRAVDEVSFSIAPGETVGLVGESGSGKTTIGRAILGLAPIAGGTVRFAGDDVSKASHRQRRDLSADLQVVFQDPYSSLNPTRTIGQTLAEVLRVHGRHSAADVRGRVQTMLERVGLTADAASRYPAQFSGGQRQRVAIARALMKEPRLVICDEPTSALDLSVQAQVLNLLRDLQRDLGVSYLFISHDLAVVRHLSHRIIVLYQGRIMEQGEAGTVYANPRHPYTQALLAAAPVPDPAQQRQRRLTTIRRDSARTTINRSDACPFASRCAHVIDICRTSRPSLEPGATRSLIACHRWRELDSGISGQDAPSQAGHPGRERAARVHGS
jgi:oligopeptide/dipeptide ABC transporter ATP-binding protein